MSRLSAGPGPQAARRASLFEVPAHFKSFPKGSSHVCFLQDPHDLEGSQEDFRRRHKKVYYENTYRMDPPEKFGAERVTSIIEEVLKDSLADKTYQPILCSSLSKTLAQEIKSRVKELDYKRYKLISVVTIGEKKDQGVRVGSRCVWDKDRDNFASGMFENTHIYAVGTVYAIYYE